MSIVIGVSRYWKEFLEIIDGTPDIEDCLLAVENKCRFEGQAANLILNKNPSNKQLRRLIKAAKRKIVRIDAGRKLVLMNLTVEDLECIRDYVPFPNLVEFVEEELKERSEETTIVLK